jgi:ABC-type multidrug transport system fused ATPase/permease subunit
LCVTYPHNEKPALQDVTLDITPGSRAALVGPSGSGKTTLADAVLGLLPLASGAITIGGTDIFDVLPDWRQSVGYVPQDVVIIDDTVAANVALGWAGEQIDPVRVKWALEKSQAVQFVSELPHGIDTFLGERGTRISGGQRQRIGIARALYTRPTFLVLDEATSALDVETERMVMDAIDRLHGDITVLVIAHRLSTVRSADLVVYLEGGEVRAHGSFTEVVGVEPHFAEHARLSGLA